MTKSQLYTNFGPYPFLSIVLQLHIQYMNNESETSERESGVGIEPLTSELETEEPNPLAIDPL